MDLRALPRRGQVPVAVEIAVPVEPTAETGLLVGRAEIRQVVFAEPIRQWPVGADIAEKSLAVFDEQRGAWIGKAAPERGSHRQANIALELALCDARRLKVLPIEIGDSAFAQTIERPATASARRGDAPARNGGETIGAEQRGVPGDRRAPVMTDDDRLLFAKRGDQRDHVADGIEDAVGTDIGRRSGSAETAHIRRNNMETRSRKRRDLMPPRIRQFRPAMAKQHQRTFALFEQEDLDAVGGNGA